MTLVVPIRSPTGRAWISFATSFIVAGELFYDLRKNEAANYFNHQLSDAQLFPIIVLFALIALASLVWLILLYVRPGSLTLDSEEARVSRTRRKMLRRWTVEAPARDWRVRMVFFTDEHRQQGVFKRIELRGPNYEEVLLFGDLKRGEDLARALDALGDQLGELRVDVESSRPRPDVEAPQAGAGQAGP
jgi:hypothetical protein